MKKHPSPSTAFCPPDFMGTTVVGERGQVVIPKEVRDNLELKAGSRLVVLQHPKGGIIMLPLEQMRDVMDTMTKQFQDIKKSLKN